MTKTFTVETGTWETTERMITENFDEAVEKARFIENDEITGGTFIIVHENGKMIEVINCEDMFEDDK